MKIGCAGAGGTGKTTVLKLLAKSLHEPVLPSVVRGVFKEFGIKSEDDQLGKDSEFLWTLQRVILERKLERDLVTPEFVCDRTPLDHWVYCLFRCNAHLSGTEEFAYWENEIRDALRGYDVIFYFPTGLFTPGDDGMRVQSAAYHAMIDSMLRGYLERWRVPYFPMNFEGPPLRADVMMSEITRLRVGQ